MSFARAIPVSLIVAAMCATGLSAGARSPRDRFVDRWQGQHVVLKQTLHSLVFDERSRVLPSVKRRDRVVGLTVATATRTYYQFDARRDEEDDIVAPGPEQVLDALKSQYRRSESLGEFSRQEIEATMLVRYERGSELVVRDVQVDRDRVRLMLYRDGAAEAATAITVQLEAPLSKELSEAPLVEKVLSRFLATVR